MLSTFRNKNFLKKNIHSSKETKKTLNAFVIVTHEKIYKTYKVWLIKETNETKHKLKNDSNCVLIKRLGWHVATQIIA